MDLCLKASGAKATDNIYTKSYRGGISVNKIIKLSKHQKYFENNTFNLNYSILQTFMFTYFFAMVKKKTYLGVICSTQEGT